MRMRWKLYKTAKDLPQEHNYQKKVALLAAQGLFTPGVHEVFIAHDEWCGVHQGKRCNCDPDVTLKTRSQVHQQG
jgi:hypothetical protein